MHLHQQETPNPLAQDFNNRGQFNYLNHCHNNPKPVYIPTDIAIETDFTFWKFQIKQMLRRMESLEAKNCRLRSKVSTLADRVSMVEGDNSSLRKIIQKSKEQETLHPLDVALQAEIRDLKTKQEEIISQ